ncbi:DUF3025 domain-containing protein [Cupriavidus sp. AU9028]|uniref:DUF3025 domain-containing protein n=1 Tax=Cupriavidus sp. AU9028 TaxID=2871157 RepID=UPI001C93E391|nr:DUF3025 domain-containing protein [Cupriavidus sp. AU9028]MBY4898941.1 DUF3025 domain-containing protein [Cupriavidus sp. AU9028]
MLAAIDWSRPWFAGFADDGRRLAARLQQGASAAQALNDCLDAACDAGQVRNGAGLPLRFVTQQELPEGRAYEAHIFATGKVPTRDNLHDIFNGLVWLRFPRAKAMLNRLQAEAIAADGVQGRRGPVRDAATLFDENGAIFLFRDARAEAQLRAFDWRALFVQERGDWHAGRTVLPFGHALLEKLAAPYKSLTAHAWTLPFPLAADDPGEPAVDQALAHGLAAARDGEALHGRAFAPLPVLGIPGWCDANAEPSFYDDAAVFRPGRRAAQAWSGDAGRHWC